MIEAKLKLLSILSAHTADRLGDAKMSPDNVERVVEYSQMFYLLANDVMNTLYGTEEDEGTDDPMADLEAACEDDDVRFEEVKRHGATYLNLMLDSGKMESCTHTKLSKLLAKVTHPTLHDK